MSEARKNLGLGALALLPIVCCIDTAKRIGRGEIVPDQDADGVVDALTIAMLDSEGWDGAELTARGRQRDEIIRIAQQMSEHFYE